MATISHEQDAQNLICQALLDAFPMADRVADNYAAVAVKALRSQAGVSEAAAWETHKVAGEAAVHSMVIGGVLCRWWGDTEPEGVSLLNNLRPAPIEITEEGKDE